jgi:hypothetical protein
MVVVKNPVNCMSFNAAIEEQILFTEKRKDAGSFGRRFRRNNESSVQVLDQFFFNATIDVTLAENNRTNFVVNGTSNRPIPCSVYSYISEYACIY